MQSIPETNTTTAFKMGLIEWNILRRPKEAWPIGVVVFSLLRTEVSWGLLE